MSTFWGIQQLALSYQLGQTFQGKTSVYCLTGTGRGVSFGLNNLLGGFRNTGFNPLNSNSDHRQFSPNNIHMLPREMVMRVNKMITKEKML